MTEIVGVDVAHSAWVCSPDFGEMHVADLVLTWLSQAAPVADTYHGFMLWVQTVEIDNSRLVIYKTLVVRLLVSIRQVPTC